MKRRLLSAFLVVCMMLTMIPSVAFAADGNVAKIGETEYATLDEAVEEAVEGATIELLGDCELTKGFNKTLTFTGTGKISINKQLTSNGEGWMCFGLYDPSRVLTFDGPGVSVEWKSEVGTAPWLMLSLSGTLNVTNGAKVSFVVDSGSTGSRNAIYMNANSAINISNGATFEIRGFDTKGKEGQGIQLDKPGTAEINVTGNSTFLIDGTNRGYVNSPAIYVEDSTFTVQNCTANASNGGEFTAVNSQITYEDNNGHGLSAGNVTFENSTLNANRNAYYGLTYSGDLTMDSTSVINANENGFGYTGGGLRAYGTSTVETGAKINIVDNKRNGMENYGTFTMEDGVQFTATGNNEPSTNGGGIYNGGTLTLPSKAIITNNYAEQTGGGICNAGSVTIPQGVLLYNNHAGTAGDDLHNRDGATAELIAVGDNWILDDCNEAITGWYDDSEGNRWEAHTGPFHAVEYVVETTATVTGLQSLKAAHGVSPLEPGDGEGNWQFSKSKTATQLDSNYQSKVTLSLPSREEELVSDVVFVLDESSAYEAVVDEMDTMLQELAQQVTETGATVNVGFVVFRGDAQTRPLEKLTEENISAINEFITTRPETPGSNMMAGLEAARQMLEADTEVADNRKYMIVVSDGITYTWTGEDGVQKGINFANGDAPNTPMLASPDSWDTKYGFNNKYVPANWNQHLQTVEGMLENTIAEKASNYVRGVDISENPFVAYSEKDNYASSVDIALYQCAQIYQALDAKYNCYTVMRSAPLGSGVEADNYPFGPSFMEYLGGDLVDFSQIEKDIYYALDAGSRVEDVIGYGTDNKGAEYNFDFVDDASALKLTVGEGEPYFVEPTTLDSATNETACYLFLESQTAENASFVLHYYENGKDGNSDECFVWDINVPVSNFAPVQLTYTVELTNPSEVSGTHGQYDEDGHDEAGNPQYDSLKTNLEAILYPVDSNDTAGRPEKFYTPTVSYNVGAISIEPADITIYTGGEGYESAVEGSGDSEVGKTSNGLPEPGFYITLPADVNQALIEKADPDDVTEVEIEQEDGTTVKQDVVDLSKYLKFTYEDEEGNERLWELERYDNQQGNTSMAYSRYIYRIKPSTIQGGEPIPIRLQFTDEENNISITDDFEVNLDGLYQTYKMTIYAGDLNQGLVKAVVTVPGQEAEEYQAEVLEGDLTIRGVTDQNTMTTDVVKNENGPTEAVEDITAHVPEEAKFYINESQLEVADPESVKLLVDSIVEDENNTLHNEAIDEFAEITADHNVQLNYLDLVDESNGNAWVTTGKQPITVYWPYPEGTDKNDDFYIVHYEGLDRNDNEALENDRYTMELYSKDSKENGLETTDQGIRITVDSFSPFALFWEEDDIPVIDEPDGGDEDPIRYTLTYVSNGGTEYDPERYNANTVVQIDKQPIREGYTFEGWYLDEELTEPVDEVKMTRNITVYAKWEPTSVPGDLNGDDHFAYIIGRDDGYIHPTDNINRAEVAAIFFRLLKEDVRQANLTDTHSFNDVDADMWYNTSVATMAKMGIVTGDPDGSFRPEDSITRAEFAAIAARFDEIAYDGEDLFSDIAGHWAQEEINAAANNGWILGYTDGTFGPQKYITRAEAMTLVNRVLNRLPEDTSDLLDDMIRWPDNQDTNIWYYLAVQEATNSHDYERKSDGVHEKWTALNENEDWVKYQ